MFLALGAIGIGFVSGWSVSSARLSAKRLLMYLLAVPIVVVETRIVCSEMSTCVICLTMVVAFGLRYLLERVLSIRQAT